MISMLSKQIRFLRALRSRPFAFLWYGQTISVIGDGAFMVAIGWSVLILTGSATDTAEVLIAQTIPRVLFLLIGGVIADRLPRRLIMFCSDSVRAVTVLLVAGLFWFHLLSFWHLLALAVVFGIGDAFFIPAYQAIPPQLVPSEDLPSANSLTVLTQQGGLLVGSAVGALLLALTNPASAFALDGLTFLISASCLLAIRLPKPAPGAAIKEPEIAPVRNGRRGPIHAVGGMLKEIGEGFAYLLRSPWLWVGTVLSAIGNVGLATQQVALPKLVHTVFGQGVWLLGALLSAGGIGSIIASLVIGQFPKVRRRGVIAYLAATLSFCALLALGIPVPHRFVVYTSLAESTIIGFGLGIFAVVYYTTLQQMVPEDKLGRVTSIDWLGSFALQPLGMAIIGIAADRWGPSPVFVVAGAINIVLFLGALSMRGIRNVERWLPTEEAPESPEITQREPEPEHEAAIPLPLLPFQQQLWALYQHYPSSTADHIVSATSISGPLDLEALARSLHVLMQRHETLRIRVTGTSDAPTQVILPCQPPHQLTLDDISQIPGTAQAQAVKDHIERVARHPFDLYRQAPFRIQLLKLTDDRHILILVFDRMIADSSTLGSLLHELETLYTFAHTGASDAALAHHLPPSQPSYRDYILLQYAHQHQDDLTITIADTLRATAATLQDTPIALDIGRNTTSSSTAGGTAATLQQACTFTIEQSDAILQGSRRYGVSPDSILLAAWALTLSRYSTHHDLVLGLQQDRQEWAHLPIPHRQATTVRIELHDHMTFPDLIHLAEDSIHQINEQTSLPPKALIHTLVAEGRLIADTDTLSTTMFTTRDTAPTDLHLPGVTCLPYQVQPASPLGNLTFEWWMEGTLIQVRIESTGGLISSSFLEQVLHHLQSFLLTGISHPASPVLELPWLSPAERDTILRRWNQTWRSLPPNHLVQDYIVQQAIHQPEATAVIATYQDRLVHLTYGDLFRHATELATHMRQMGIGPDTAVGVLFDRSIAWVVAQMATLLAGGYYISIDPGQPVERINTILREAQPQIVITSHQLLHQVQTYLEDTATPLHTLISPDRILYLEPQSGAIADTVHRMPAYGPITATYKGEQDPTHPTGQNLAYAIFTSGSTGVPKGVSLTHAGLLNLTAWFCEAFELGSADRCTCLAGLGFDATVWEIWPTLVSGACLFLVDDLTRLDPERLQEFFLANEITVAFVPTPLCERMLTLPWPPALPLRSMITGGDRLHTFVPNGLPFALYNAYGPSEATVCSTWGPVPSAAQAKTQGLSTPTIGWPIANTQIYVLDSHQQPVPVGVQGELYIGGLGLARTYMNQPELTRAKFVSNPFAPSSVATDGTTSPGSDRLYRTGDLVKWTATGELQYLGRSDTQIKIRGFRIEPGEIEAALCHHPGVRAALVVALDRGQTTGGPHEPQLVAFVEADPHQVSESELRQLLLQHLPRYMVPARLALLERLPLTRNGKLDRSAALQILRETDRSPSLQHIGAR